MVRNLEWVNKLLQYILLFCGVLMLLGCTSNQAETQVLSVQRDASHSTKVTLSYVRAYLQIGNINKARLQFDKIEEPELDPGAMLTLAELRAAEGDIIGAEQAFLFSLADNQLTSPFNPNAVSSNLIDSLCQQKRWSALEAYAGALNDAAAVIDTSNAHLSKIGLCFFNGQRSQAAKHALEQLDFNLAVPPFSYLALARISLEQGQYLAAKTWMEKFEANKTSVDATTLWISFEVYRALKRTGPALKVAEHLRSLFPKSQYESRLQLQLKPAQVRPLMADKVAPSKSLKKSSTKNFHLIRSGETLYQLSKRYALSMSELLLWNPDLLIEEISLGTRIRISEPD
jgi:Tfp pilus assembly protein PilF